VRKRAQGAAVQLWGEVEKVVGGLVWEMWGGVVRPCVGDCSPELVLGATSSGASGGAFISARGGMVAWARAAGEGETRGKTGGAADSLAPTARWRHGRATGRQGLRRREQGEDDGTSMQETKTAGAWVKKELKLILPKVKTKTF
jgi:hypothetical protein